MALHMALQIALQKIREIIEKKHHPEHACKIAVTGSVAVEKSTFARALVKELSTGPCRESSGILPGERLGDASCCSLLSTDHFLWSNATLRQQGLMTKKGFPQSYNLQQFQALLSAYGLAREQVKQQSVFPILLPGYNVFS